MVNQEAELEAFMLWTWV